MTEDYRILELPEVRDPAADLAALRVHVEGLQARVEALEEAENDRRFEQAKAIIDKPPPSAAVIGEAFGGGRLAGFISHTADGHPTHALIVAPSANAQPEPAPAPAGSLVERVARLLAEKLVGHDDPHEMWRIDARAALREVAAWLESSQWMWCASAAEVVADVVAQLRQEADRG
jgi:hypothetical protein